MVLYPNTHIHRFTVGYYLGIHTNMGGGGCGLMVRVGLVIQRSRVRVSGPVGIVGGWGEQGTEPWAPQHKWLPTVPGVCSRCVCVCVFTVCVFTAVCVHFGWVKCRAQVPSMGHHTWSYVTSLSLFTFKHNLLYQKWTFGELLGKTLDV